MNLTQSSEILNLLLPLIKRFPSFPTANALYNRNFVSVFRAAIERLRAQGQSVQSSHTEQLTCCHIHFSESVTGRHDQDKLQALNKLLTEEAANLKRHLKKLKSIEQDLVYLKNLDDRFDHNSKKLIRLAPFLYDQNGKAINAAGLIHFSCKHYSPTEIQNVFDDHFRLYLAPIIENVAKKKGFGQLQKITNNTLNQFIPKHVLTATQIYNATQEKVASRHILLEEVPALYSTLRGAVAKDCSMVSVPFYGLLKQVRVFWIFKSQNSQGVPEGYVLLLENEHNNSIMPCVLTINGPNLTQSDVHAVFKALAEIYNTETITVADWNYTKFLVNYSPIREALDQCKTQLADMFKLPEHWSEMTDESFNFDCYSESHLSRFLSLNINDLPLKSFSSKVSEVDNLYPNVFDSTSLPVIDRAIVGYYFKQDNLNSALLAGQSGRSNALVKSEDYSDVEWNYWIESQLSISSNQLTSIKHFFDLYVNKTFTVEVFWILNREFNFNLMDLLSIDVLLRAPVIIELIKLENNAIESVFSSQALKKVCQNTFQQLNEKLQDTTLNPETHSFIKDQLTALPDKYVENYWGVVRQFLYNSSGHLPDYYALQRMVKHLKSKSAIESMMSFFLEETVFLTFVRPQDKRWYEFFKQAESVQVDDIVLTKVLYESYFKKMLSTDSNLAIYETAKIFAFSLKLNLFKKISLLDDVDLSDVNMFEAHDNYEHWLNVVANAQNYEGDVRVEFQNRVDTELKSLVNV